jgi:ribonucleoside-diphosphate reductase beta chain
VLASYHHFLQVAARSRWDEADIDLAADAAAWHRVPAADRLGIEALVAAFQLGEQAVAEELEPFAVRAPDAVAADCFRAQQVDEARHARFFRRVGREVLGFPEQGASRDLVEPAFAELFERRLAAVAARLEAGQVPIAAAVSLYHLLLEGVVFAAGQTALLALLEERPELGGMRRGVELVCRDERWHLGLGARILQDAGLSADAGAELVAEGDRVLAAWGARLPADVVERARRLHRRRLRAAGLTARHDGSGIDTRWATFTS